MSFKKNLKEYFTFTKGESQGILVLLVLLGIVIIINSSAEYFTKQPTYDFSKYKKLFTEFNSDTLNNEAYSHLLKYDTLNLFRFNPNNLNKKDAKQLGLSEYQYQMIQNYLASGGYFKYKSDFSKIYSIHNEQFILLRTYIDLPEKKNKNNSEYNVKKKILGQQIKINYFNFDPNILDDFGWKKLGFSEKQIASIRKYINSGGKFYKKEDLKKLYVINEEKYSELEPYIIINNKDENSKNAQNKVKKKVDINNLSADEMKKYGRFWQYNAERIVKYRNLLGGYYKKEQLTEVYGIKRDYYDKIADDIIIDKSKIEKININFAEVSELLRHPYISYQDAKKIIEYRNKNGSYKNLEDLINKNVIPKPLYKKISPYLKVR